MLNKTQLNQINLLLDNHRHTAQIQLQKHKREMLVLTLAAVLSLAFLLMLLIKPNSLFMTQPILMTISLSSSLILLIIVVFQAVLSGRKNTLLTINRERSLANSLQKIAPTSSKIQEIDLLTTLEKETKHQLRQPIRQPMKTIKSIT